MMGCYLYKFILLKIIIIHRNYYSSIEVLFKIVIIDQNKTPNYYDIKIHVYINCSVFY